MNNKEVRQSSMYWIIGVIMSISIMITCLFWHCIQPDNWLLFWGSLIWGIATLVAVVYSVKKNWEQQYDILKDNIKIQLFDKRYAVYNTLCSANVFINRQDIILMIMAGVMDEREVQKKLYDYSESLREITLLSEAIFDTEIHSKMKQLSQKYYAIFMIFLSLRKKETGLFIPDDKQQQFSEILANLLGNEKNILVELEKIIPNIQNIISDFNKSLSEFNTYLQDSQIMNDFDKYLKIYDLDK